MYLPPVVNSLELQRILRLPRRVLSEDTTEDQTYKYLISEPDQSGDTMRLRWLQSASLIEAEKANGLFGAIGVGYGKTLISLLLPTAMKSCKAVLLVPSQLRRQLVQKEAPKYAKYFRLPVENIFVVTHNELSNQKHADVLERISPDLVIVDEAHAFRYRSSARTKRLLRFAERHPECRFVFLSGTMTTRSLRDYAHLLELALRKNSPLPDGYHELMDWSGAIDVKPDEPKAPGALLQFCLPGEDVRSGYSRRLRETAGVVVSRDGELGMSLIIKRIKRSLQPKIPQVVLDLRDHLLKFWEIKNGDFEEEISDALGMNRFLRQLACGFYYKWVWPNGKDREWLDARRSWHREVRNYLARSSRPDRDSEALLTKAAIRGDWKSETWPVWSVIKERYKPEPPTETVWLDDFACTRAIELAEQAVKQRKELSSGGSIIWFDQVAVGERLGKMGVPVYRDKDSSFATAKIIACSLHSQVEGKNLQDRYSHNVIMTPPANGTTWEQCMGRTHRSGQEADDVVVEWFGHTFEYQDAFNNALLDAKYQEETMGRQKLIYATKVDYE